MKLECLFSYFNRLIIMQIDGRQIRRNRLKLGSKRQHRIISSIILTNLN